MTRFFRLAILVLLMVLAGHDATAYGQRSLAGAVVVLDPGHGGDDWGVDPAGSKQREKDVVLDLGARLQQQLRAEGATVHTTRHTDRFVSLGARVRFANALLFRPDNDLGVGRVISLHLNSNRENPGLERVEVLVDPQAEVPQFAVLMAQALQEVTQGGYGYRDEGYPPGVHPGDVAPIRWTYPRGNNVLTEPVFLSNPEQDALLYDERFLERLAQAHVDALVATLR